jgi:hypothetical protein
MLRTMKLLMMTKEFLKAVIDMAIFYLSGRLVERSVILFCILEGPASNLSSECGYFDSDFS